MGHIWTILRADFGAIGHVMRVSEPKTEMPIVGLNSSSSKTNRTSGIEVSNLEASGQAVSAPKNKLWRFRHFLFSSLGLPRRFASEVLKFFPGKIYEFVNKN